MLVLSRRVGEEIVIDGNVRVTVLECNGTRVRLGIVAPTSVRVVREELLPGLLASSRKAARAPAPVEKPKPR